MRNIYKGVVAAGLLWTATVNVNGQQRGVIENVFVDVNSYNDSEYAVPAHLIGGMVTEGSVYGTFDSTEEYEFVTLNGETEPSSFLVSSYMNQYITALDMEEIRNYININGQVMLMWDGSNRQYSINFISRGNLPKPAAFCPEMQIIINHNIYLTSDESNAYALPKVVFPLGNTLRPNLVSSVASVEQISIMPFIPSQSGTARYYNLMPPFEYDNTDQTDGI